MMQLARALHCSYHGAAALTSHVPSTAAFAIACTTSSIASSTDAPYPSCGSGPCSGAASVLAAILPPHPGQDDRVPSPRALLQLRRAVRAWPPVPTPFLPRGRRLPSRQHGQGGGGATLGDQNDNLVVCHSSARCSQHLHRVHNAVLCRHPWPQSPSWTAVRPTTLSTQGSCTVLGCSWHGPHFRSQWPMVTTSHVRVSSAMWSRALARRTSPSAVSVSTWASSTSSSASTTSTPWDPSCGILWTSLCLFGGALIVSPGRGRAPLPVPPEDWLFALSRATPAATAGTPPGAVQHSLR